MMMPGREYQAQPSRFGFNGKENDNEVKGFGNQQDYGMRVYDGRIGRFLSVDPLSKGYAMLTPYQFASNSPIIGLDQDGGEFKYYGLNWSNNSSTRLKVGRLIKTDEDITFTLVFVQTDFTGKKTVEIPISVDRKLVGLTGTFVNYKGESVRIPDNANLKNLAPQTDPIWDTYETDYESDENFLGAVNLIVQKVNNLAAFQQLISSGGLPAYLADKGAAASVAMLAKARRDAVRNAWKQEKELVLTTGRGTREWTKKEIAELKRKGKVKGYEGDHINSVAKHPEMAGDPNNIQFLKGRRSSNNEHLKEHGGDYHNQKSGEPIDRQKMIDEHKKTQSNGSG